MTNTSKVNLWTFKGLLKKIENKTKSDSNFAPVLINYYPLPYVKRNGYCLINNSTVSLKIINLDISYTLDRWSRYFNRDFTSNNCLFGLVKLTKTLIQINTNIAATSENLILVQNFH